MKKKILLWIWCFPQMLAGLIVKHVTKATRNGDHYWLSVGWDIIPLGDYIFLCPKHYGNKKVLRHKKGHVKQSRILGWLYLPIIGLSSLVWARCFGWYREKFNVSYYSFYTEKWADKLGGIKR